MSWLPICFQHCFQKCPVVDEQLKLLMISNPLREFEHPKTCTYECRSTVTESGADLFNKRESQSFFGL